MRWKGASFVDPALDFVGAGPPSLASRSWLGARRAADRGVAKVMQRVVGKVVLVDVSPQVLLRPVGQRVDLPDAPALVPLELGRVRARRRLLTADPRDPRLNSLERPFERIHLGHAAAVLSRPRCIWVAAIEDLDVGAEAV